MYDYIIIGAGLSGITAANILANKDKKILLLEQRNHIGGNCYDYYEQGILVHKYGPHIFHTDNKKVWDYLSQFTEWNNYKHKVKVEVDGKLVSLPINLNSIDKLVCRDIFDTLITCFNLESQISIYDLLESKNITLNELGNYLYNNIYKNYSSKQWGKYFDKLDKSILKRIPIRINYNDEYFTDQYQGLPKNGYTKMFNRMLDYKNIEVVLNTEASCIDFYSDLKNPPVIIYTGRIDELFNYNYGILPYQSLDINFEEFKDIEYFQECGVINYPNKKVKITRKTEYKYLTQQKNEGTVLSYECPKECKEGDIPYYPILTDKNKKLYNKYKKLIDKNPNIILLGRLAEYKYYDMDDIVNRVMEEVEKL